MFDLGFYEVVERADFILKAPSNNTDPRIEQTRFLAYSVFAPIIVSVGLIGNLLTIVTLRLPQFRGPTYTFFLVLAITDLLSLFFCISMLIHLLQGGTHHYTTAVWYSYCELIFINVPMSTSTLIIICITIDRYYSVCKPVKFKSIHTDRNALIGITVSMIIAVTVWLPSAALKVPKNYKECPTTSFEPPSEGTWWVSCMKTSVRKHPWYVTYSWVRQSITIFIPAIALVILNCFIVKGFIKLRRKRKQMRGHELPDDSPTTAKKKRENKHLIHLLTAVMISFFVTSVPSGIFGAIYDENLSTRFRFELFRALANDLEILNHALNFYLYILYSKPIRGAIVNLFSVKKKLLSAVVVSNVNAVTQKDKKDKNDTQNGTIGIEVTIRTSAKIKKNKKEVRETQYSDLDSDEESTFSKIISAEEKPKQISMVPKNQELSNAQDSFIFPLQNRQPEENVYLKAVENRNNKPASGFSTIVHIAEVHCSSSDDSAIDLPLTTTDDTESITGGMETVEESKSHYSEQRPAASHHCNGPLNDSNAIEKTDARIEQENISSVVAHLTSENKESGGYVNPGFELDEMSIDPKNTKLPNGNIANSSFFVEKT